VSVVAFNERFAGAWAATMGDDRICIAVLDGPVDRTHVTFKDAKLTELKGTLSLPCALPI